MVEIRAGIDWSDAQPSQPTAEARVDKSTRTKPADRQPAPFIGVARFIGNFGEWDKSVTETQRRARARIAHSQTDAVYADPKFGSKMYPGYGMRG